MTPDDNTIQELFLEVGDGHQIYVQDWGNKNIKTPILFFHGGPGGGCKDKHKTVFDPKKHRVIFHDQRGCGRSLPNALVQANTTNHLVEDINKILDHFKIKKFIVYGGSWGSALPLTYGIKYPERVERMILHSIFAYTKFETEWLNGGYKTHYPDAWDRLLARTPKAHHSNPASYHFDKVKNGTPDEVLASALAVDETEHSLMTIDDRFRPIDPTTFDPTSAIIFVHYASNDWFMPEDYILNNAHKLTMPIRMVHGRYDMDCPPITAHKLNKVLPNSTLTWVIGGHHVEHEMDTVLRLALQDIS